MQDARSRIGNLFYLSEPYFELVDKMIELKTFHHIESDEDIRLIFFFDN
jgi:hypothetical protein